MQQEDFFKPTALTFVQDVITYYTRTLPYLLYASPQAVSSPTFSLTAILLNLVLDHPPVHHPPSDAPRFSFTAVLSDLTGAFAVHFYGRQAESLLGVTVQDYLQMPKHSQDYLLKEKRRYTEVELEVEGGYGAVGGLRYRCRRVRIKDRWDGMRHMLSWLDEHRREHWQEEAR